MMHDDASNNLGFIVYAIVTVEELRSQTRYVLLFGMIIGNILIFVILLNEVAYYVSPSEELCKFYRALLGLPYLIFSLNYLLVLVDNYVAITRPALHLTRFTVRNVLPCQIALNIFVCFIAKFLIVIGAVALNCQPSAELRLMVNAILAILIATCVVLKVLIYVKTRRSDTTDHRHHDDNNRNAIEMNDAEVGGRTGLRANATDQATIAKRDKKAMRALMISVLTLLAIYIPRTMLALYTFICVKWNGLIAEEECSFLDARPYLTEFTALHGIIQPVSFLCLYDQFWTSWKNRQRS